MSGTSQAAPLVTAAAAVLSSYGLSAPQIKARIIASAELRANLEGQVFAEGMFSFERALYVYSDVLVRKASDDGGQMETGVLTTDSRNEKNEYTLIYRSNRNKRITPIDLWRVLKVSVTDVSTKGNVGVRLVYMTSDKKPDVQVDRGLLCSHLRFGQDPAHGTDLTLQPRLDITLGPLINQVHKFARRLNKDQRSPPTPASHLSSKIEPTTCQEFQ